MVHNGGTEASKTCFSSSMEIENKKLVTAGPLTGESNISTNYAILGIFRLSSTARQHVAELCRPLAPFAALLSALLQRRPWYQIIQLSSSGSTYK